jgi:peptidoglycan/xylan/chitin deacetylase (PgdA/CDA1 family)
VARVEAELGRPCRHFSYPYGDAGSAGEREFDVAARLGLLTAVTTRKGLVTGTACARPTALPRLSLNGHYQHMRYFKPLLAGAPFALVDALRRRAHSPAGSSGFCIQRTSHAAGTTQASPPTT